MDSGKGSKGIGRVIDPSRSPIPSPSRRLSSREMKSMLIVVPLLFLAVLTACREAVPARTPEEVASERVAKAELTQQSAEGALLVAHIQEKYPGVKGIEVSLFGEATPTPSMGLYIPEPELRSLTEKQISSLSAILRTHIPKARKNPDSYMSVPPAAPFYARARQNVIGTKDEAWFIGAGRVEGRKLFYDHVAITGSDYRK